MRAEMTIGEDQVGGLVEEVTPDMKLVGACGRAGAAVPRLDRAAGWAGLGRRWSLLLL